MPLIPQVGTVLKVAPVQTPLSLTHRDRTRSVSRILTFPCVGLAFSPYPLLRFSKQAYVVVKTALLGQKRGNFRHLVGRNFLARNRTFRSVIRPIIADWGCIGLSRRSKEFL